MKHGEETINGVVISLNPFFTHPEWIDKWKQNMIPFTHKIKVFASEWNVAIQLLESLTIQSGLLTIEMQGLKNQLVEITIELSTLEIKKSEQEKIYTELLEQRKILLNGESTETVEQILKQSIDLHLNI